MRIKDQLKVWVTIETEEKTCTSTQESITKETNELICVNTSKKK